MHHLSQGASSVVRHVSLLVVVLSLLALALAPGAAGVARAQSAVPAEPAIPATCGCIPPGITLHYHSQIGGLITPYRMGTDAQGNLYVSDIANDVVYMYTATNLFVRGFGSGHIGTGNGDFNIPEGVAVSGNNVFVVDYGNGLIQRFDRSNGNFLSQFGSGTLSSPLGLTLASNGQLYVVDGGHSQIARFSTSGTYLGSFGSNGSGNGQFMGPQGIAASALGYVYVTDGANNRVEQFDLSGNFIATWGSTYMLNPDGIAVDRANMVYVDDRSHQRIFKFDPNGRSTGFYAAPGGGAGKFSDPGDVAVVSLPNTPTAIYISDLGQAVVQRFDSAIEPTYHPYEAQWGTGGSGNGQFNALYGIAFNQSNGQIYTMEANGERVQRFGSPWAKRDTVGIYRPSTKTFYLRNENSTGPAEIVVPMPYALSGDLPVVGDWNGDGVDTVGLYRSSTGTFLLQDANVQESAPDYTFTLGVSGDTPISGDWSGGGHDGAGVFRPSNGILYLKNALSTGFADYSMVLGVPGDHGVAGDWNGDGQDSPGVYRPSNQTYYLSNKVTNGVVFSDYVATLGISGDVPFTGDWISQGSSGIGVFRPSNGVTYEKNALTTGPADNFFIYGVAGDVPVAGQWVYPLIVSAPPPGHASTGALYAGPAGRTPVSPPTSQPRERMTPAGPR